MAPPPRRQRSLQYFTSVQTRSHFFRQVNGLPQRAQSFAGRSEGGRWQPGREGIPGFCPCGATAQGGR